MPAMFQYLTADLENVQLCQGLPPHRKADRVGVKIIMKTLSEAARQGQRPMLCFLGIVLLTIPLLTACASHRHDEVTDGPAPRDAYGEPVMGRYER